MRYALIAVLSLALQAQAALAQLSPPVKAPRQVGITSGGVIGIACLGLRWLFTAAIIFSIVMVLVAAFQYMKSSGDPAGTKAATSKLVYAAIGVAVAIFARTFPILISSFLQAGGTTDVAALCTS